MGVDASDYPSGGSQSVCKVLRVGPDIFTAKEDMFRVNATMATRSGYLFGNGDEISSPSRRIDLG